MYLKAKSRWLLAGISLFISNCSTSLELNHHTPKTATNLQEQGVLLKQTSPDFDYDHVLVKERFRIFYTINESNTSPKDLTDNDANQLPDYIENILQKLILARKILTQQLHLKDPFNEGRFHDKQVRYIDIFFNDIPKHYGIASGLVKELKTELLANSDFQGKSIRITLHRDLISSSATPMHELFHLFQFNYAEFYNRWFSEGLARWSEGLVNPKPLKSPFIPSNNLELKELFSKAHAAGAFWQTLLLLCNQPDKTSTHTAYPLIKGVLEATEKQYRLLKPNSNTATDWPIQQARADSNNVYLINAINEAVAEECPDKNEALSQFSKLQP